jgi:hypothetical protein
VSEFEIYDFGRREGMSFLAEGVTVLAQGSDALLEGALQALSRSGPSIDLVIPALVCDHNAEA